MRKITNEKEQGNTKTERNNGMVQAVVKVRAKWFYCGFKLGFVRLICKATLNFLLVLSVILKERELYKL